MPVVKYFRGTTDFVASVVLEEDGPRPLTQAWQSTFLQLPLSSPDPVVALYADEDFDIRNHFRQMQYPVLDRRYPDDPPFTVVYVLPSGKFLYAESTGPTLYAESMTATLYAESLQ